MTDETREHRDHDDRPGAAGAGLGGVRDAGPAAGSGDAVVADLSPDDIERLRNRNNDGPAGTMDSSGGDLDEAG